MVTQEQLLILVCSISERWQMLIMVIHVDGFAIASSDDQLRSELLCVLRSRYIISTSSLLETFLGIHLKYLSDGSVLMTQPSKIDEVLLMTGRRPDKVATVPMSTLFNDSDQNMSPRCDQKEYLKLLGKLIFVTKTRPDVSYAVNRLATRSQVATEKDWYALVRVVSYLEGTKNLGIRFEKGLGSDGVVLNGWVDASYATHGDSKSHTGYCLSLGSARNGMFYSRTLKQSNVTLSSTEAENAAAVECVKEIIWFRQLLAELGLPQASPTVLRADNSSMITLAQAFSGQHKKTKHFMVKINFMIENVKNGEIVLNHVPSEANIADILTKPLGPVDFIRLRPLLLGNAE
jgi:hypothetical protein